MENIKNRQSHATVTVSETDRDTINRLSEELDLPQRRVVSLLLENYSSAHDPPDKTIITIQQSRDQILKRIDSLIAIIRDQEKNLFKPTLINSQNTYSFQKAGVNEILSTLSHLIHLYYGR